MLLAASQPFILRGLVEHKCYRVQDLLGVRYQQGTLTVTADAS
jgi:hypothetical protein